MTYDMNDVLTWLKIGAWGMEAKVKEIVEVMSQEAAEEEAWVPAVVIFGPTVRVVFEIHGEMSVGHVFD